LEVIVKGDAIFYIVTVTGEPKPVYFKLTAINDHGFTCENPKHNFPKKITYSRSGNNAKAVISDENKSINYLFAREK